MHLIKLNIKDSSVDKVITFLKKLPEDEIEIIENRKLPAETGKKVFKAVNLKTAGFKFNRDEANAR
ncbi:MAG TPA: hypothetical protein P5120_14890 [Spirochaetota bacterium]|nr:hypothetical protein [Spirochaetota bacterium]HPF07094.1 hypothetical protein [Spirochaetota bacterium]HRX48804.1 hypothetical protein [Spirochaetota bacterium]